MRRAGLLVLIGIAACDSAPTEFTAGIYFPDEVAGIISYRAGGQFTAAVHAEIDHLVGPTHAVVSLDSALSPSTAPPQAITLYPADGGLDGATSLTWPHGGDVIVHASVAGVTVPDRVAHLVTPEISFHLLGISDSGSHWLYAYCLESTMADGVVDLHLDQAALASGSADASLTLVPGPCSPTASPLGPGAHATYTVAASGGEVRTTVVYAPASPKIFHDEVVVPAHVAPVIELTSPSAAFTPLSIVQLDVHVSVAGTPAANMIVTLQAVPPVTANTVVPATVITDAAGNATAHFQMPQSGSIGIDASIGPTRQVRVFP